MRETLFASGSAPPRHQFANCVEYHFELPIVFLLQLIELAREFYIRGKHLTQTNKALMISLFARTARSLFQNAG